jgi:hypothetical protein
VTAPPNDHAVWAHSAGLATKPFLRKQKYRWIKFIPRAALVALTPQTGIPARGNKKNFCPQGTIWQNINTRSQTWPEVRERPAARALKARHGVASMEDSGNVWLMACLVTGSQCNLR